MRIAIIGGGWVGCHLAKNLISNNSVTIFEKNKNLFSETSFNNQNRLHLGFHYPRSYKTREMCRNTYSRFINEYSWFVDYIPKNLYCVPAQSNIDFRTLLQIYNNSNYLIDNNHPFSNIEGCISTNEMYINFSSLHYYWNDIHSEITCNKNIESYEQLREYDYIIDATNNIFDQIENSYYELTITLVYNKIDSLPFGAVTMVDGNFFSIYPYTNEQYTLTDVEYTPIIRHKNYSDILNYKVTEDFVQEIRKKMESKVSIYWEHFNTYLKYDHYFLSVKSKPCSQSADRYPVIQTNGNIIKCYTGKIQGIYIIEDFVKEYMEN